MATQTLCTRCVLTHSTPGITFDDKGVCSYCSTYTPMRVEGEERLREIPNKFKAKKRKYDCMVCISGGRDSTYTLWKLVHDYQMKVLTVNYKNPSQPSRRRISQYAPRWPIRIASARTELSL